MCQEIQYKWKWFTTEKDFKGELIFKETPIVESKALLNLKEMKKNSRLFTIKD